MTDPIPKFIRWAKLGTAGTIVFICVFGLWYTTAFAQTPTTIPIKCHEGECLISEKDLARLLESNNKAVAEVIKLRKYCRDA